MRVKPTAYILGKVSLARNLESKISEECLVNKLSYRFQKSVFEASLCGQIKTIQAMANLLESYENERY